MNILKIISLAIIFCQLLACTNQKETVRETQVLVPGAKSSNGGTDSGGGNGVNGKPLESYQFNIDSLEEFKIVEQIIFATLETLPELAGDLWHISQERRWYQIPASLKALPSERIGVSFATDQLALQNLSEVWLDGSLFEKMTSEDRSILILHELVMGVRLMEFQDDLENCLSRTAYKYLQAKTEEQMLEYQVARKTCYKNLNIVGGGGFGNGGSVITDPRHLSISLSRDDYENIRKLVTQLWSKKGQIKGEEARVWLKSKSFRRY